MEVLRTKAEYSGTSINYETRGHYDVGKSGAWKYGTEDLIISLKEA